MSNIVLAIEIIQIINKIIFKFKKENKENISKILKSYKTILYDFVKKYHFLDILEEISHIKLIIECCKETTETIKIYFDKNQIYEIELLELVLVLEINNFIMELYLCITEQEKILKTSTDEKSINFSKKVKDDIIFTQDLIKKLEEIKKKLK